MNNIESASHHQRNMQDISPQNILNIQHDKKKINSLNKIKKDLPTIVYNILKNQVCMFMYGYKNENMYISFYVEIRAYSFMQTAIEKCFSNIFKDIEKVGWYFNIKQDNNRFTNNLFTIDTRPWYHHNNPAWNYRYNVEIRDRYVPSLIYVYATPSILVTPHIEKPIIRENECCSCFAKKPRYYNKNCGHCCLCHTCSKRIDFCPICRESGKFLQLKK